MDKKHTAKWGKSKNQNVYMKTNSPTRAYSRHFLCVEHDAMPF